MAPLIVFQAFLGGQIEGMKGRAAIGSFGIGIGSDDNFADEINRDWHAVVDCWQCKAAFRLTNPRWCVEPAVQPG